MNSSFPACLRRMKARLAYPQGTYREGNMKGYFVVLFANNRVYQHKMSELIQASVNGYVSTQLVPGEKRIYLPLEIHE